MNHYSIDKIFQPMTDMYWRIRMYCKHRIFHALLSIITFIWAASPKKQQKKEKYEADVYLLMSHNHCLRSIYAIASMQYFYPGIQMWVINDGTLRFIDRFVLGLFKYPVHILSSEELRQQRTKAKKYSHLVALAEYGWSGKKILYPLMHTKRKKIILLDTDILFFRKPTHISTWMYSKKKYNLYLSDYTNFSIASKNELTAVLPNTRILTHVNTGLLCLNMDAIQPTHSLLSVNRIIPKLIDIVKSRMTYDYGPNVSDFFYTPPLIEQTLYALLLSMVDSRKLPSNSYVVFPSHKFWKKPIHSPIFIHFTGEIGVNIPLYQYIFSSFIYMCMSYLYRRNTDHVPWFIQSKTYCFIRSHHHSPDGAHDYKDQ